MKTIITALLLTPFIGFTQSHSELKAVKRQLNDYEILKSALLMNHTGIYDYQDSIKFDGSLKELKTNLSIPQSELSQYVMYKQFISTINCIHTTVNSKKIDKKLNETQYQLPFSSYFVNGKLLVSSNYTDNEKILTIQDEILEINSESINSITPKLYTLISSDGQNITFKNQVLKHQYLKYYYLLKQNVGLFTIKYIHNSDTLVRIFQNQKPIIHSKNKTQKYDSLNYIIDTVKGFALLIPPYPLPRSKEYKSDIDAFFEEVKNNQIKSLIIDLRNNLGGKSQDYLAGFFTQNDYCFLTTTRNQKKRTSKRHYKKRFSSTHLIGILASRSEAVNSIAHVQNHNFSGDLFILTCGTTVSSASNLASSLKEWSQAIIIGEETGGGYRGCNSGNLILQLPYSKNQIRINVFKSKNTILNNYELDGVTPNIAVPESSLVNSKEDLQLNYILNNLIKK